MPIVDCRRLRKQIDEIPGVFVYPKEDPDAFVFLSNQCMRGRFVCWVYAASKSVPSSASVRLDRSGTAVVLAMRPDPPTLSEKS